MEALIQTAAMHHQPRQGRPQRPLQKQRLKPRRRLERCRIVTGPILCDTLVCAVRTPVCELLSAGVVLGRRQRPR